jgi:gp16 family phage-associated protein
MHTSIEIRKLFVANGESVSRWARDHGFSTALVYRVLRGDTPCVRGQTHRIAIALGLKPSPSDAEAEKFLQIKAAHSSPLNAAHGGSDQSATQCAIKPEEG